MSNRYKYTEDVKLARELGLASKWTRTVHIHLLDNKPLIGASTAKGIVSKGDVLNQWYADMAALEGLSRPQQDIKAEYLAIQDINNKFEKAKAKKELDKKYPDYAESRKAANKRRDDAADTGTARHSSLEDYIHLCLAKGGVPQEAGEVIYAPEVKAFIDWSLKEVAEFYFTEACCFHEGLWIGGIADLGLKLKNGKRLVGDHKSSKEAYPDQFLQCAIYDTALSHSGGLDKEGNKLFDWQPADGYVVFPFRSVPFTPEFRWDVDGFREMAVCAVKLYKGMEQNPLT